MVTWLNLGCKTAEDVFTLNTIFTNSPTWNTEFGILWNWPNEENERFSNFFFSGSTFLLSCLERITRWQLFNSRTTRHIDCHMNGRYAADILWESDLLWLTLCNIIFPFTSLVHHAKEKMKQLLLLSNSVSNLVSVHDEKGIFCVYCTCPSKTRFHLMSRGTRYVSSD